MINNEEWLNLKALLLGAPEGQIDSSAVDMIREWDEVPTSLQILEVADICAHAALASDFVMSVFNIMLELRLQEEGKTMEDIIPLATWRNT